LKPSVEYPKAHTSCYKEGKHLPILKSVLKEVKAFAHTQGSHFVIRLVSSTDLTGNMATWQGDASTGSSMWKGDASTGKARSNHKKL
jgi:hypothetical protein